MTTFTTNNTAAEKANAAAEVLEDLEYLRSIITNPREKECECGGEYQKCEKCGDEFQCYYCGICNCEEADVEEAAADVVSVTPSGTIKNTSPFRRAMWAAVAKLIAEEEAKGKEEE